MFRILFVALISGLLVWLSFGRGYTCSCLAQSVQEKSDFSSAVQESVHRVDSRIVNLQIWGARQTKSDLQTANHLTGVLVSSEGADTCYIVTTLFGFDPAPSAILVTDGQGNRQSGTIVARDFLHKLVLLKTTMTSAEAEAESSPVEPLESKASPPLQPGQWVVACGRVFPAWAEQNTGAGGGLAPVSGVTGNSSRFNVNVSVGILSATGRIGGLALQTDAAVSPNNYGGPLLDLTGQVLGILTPLSPEDESAMAGVEWYDSGIGFAIPMDTIGRLFPRWKQGQDLYSGWAGFGVETKNPAIAAPISSGPPADSPAQKAGLIKGDRIVAIDGQNIATMAQGIRVLNRRFAGEEISVVVERMTKPSEKSGEKSGEKLVKETLTLNMTLERRPEKIKPSAQKPIIQKREPEPQKKSDQLENGSRNDA